MIRNFFIVAWRNLRKNKSFSLINLIGLSVGLAAFVLIVLYIIDELKYDKFLKDRHLIYEVNIQGKMGGQEFYQANHPPPVGNALKTDFPGIETYTRVFLPGEVLISHEKNGVPDKYFTETKILAVDSNFFEVFQFPLLSGNVSKALHDPNAIVLTEDMAKKYFGSSDVLGEVISYGDNRVPYRIAGVLKNIPRQSSMQFDFLVPMQSYPQIKRFNWSWVYLQVFTFVKVSPAIAGDPVAIAHIEAQTPDMVKRHGAKAFERIGMPLDQLYKEGGYWKFKLQPYSDIHLGSAGINNALLQVGNKRSMYIFGIIAVFIVLLACVNFMNLSTARSFNRARETGVRKVMGSSTGKLVMQFLSESVLYSFFASVIGLLIVFLCLPAFNQLASKQLTFNDIFDGPVLLLIFGITLISGLLAGSYPAFYLSSFKPVQVLKGTLAKKGGNHFIRNSLVVFQFSISVILIICTVVVLKQLNYMQGKDLGLDKDNVIIVSNTQRLGEKQETFRQELVSTNGIAGASITTNIPSGNAFGDGYVPEAAEGETPLVNDLSIFSYLTDEYFLPSMNISMVKGRNFSKEFSDSASVIINETAARQIGWKNPIGKYLRYPGGDDTRFKVIGVAKDFTVQSFREVLVPFALFHHSSKTYSQPQSYMVVRLQAGSIQKAIASLDSKWKTFAPGTPLDYNFLDARINVLYKNEKQMSNVFLVFAVLSIMVACLGLFGLSAFAAEQRTKEIGIRKVLGASVSGIIQMLSKDFLKLVVIAAVIAFPVAWWAMSKWLEEFAYRVPIGWAIFLIAGIAAVMIALFTVSFQAIKAALMNPVKSLRSE